MNLSCGQTRAERRAICGEKDGRARAQNNMCAFIWSPFFKSLIIHLCPVAAVTMSSRETTKLVALRGKSIKVKPDVFEAIQSHLCEVTKCNDFSEAVHKIRATSKTRIKIENSFNSEVFSVPKNYVKYWAMKLNLTSVPALDSHSDLVKGSYEGGFKVWESTRDLVEFITKDQGVIKEISNREEFRVLELGAGAALPSLALINRLLEDSSAKSDYTLHLHDYNWEVLTSLTLLNFSVNLPTNYMRALVHFKRLRMFHGDWSDFRRNSSAKYDLIMMSEVIYDRDHYQSLHDLLVEHLKPDGYIVIATKDTYFGLSGGIYQWLDYLETRCVFSQLKTIKVTVTNIPRSILILKRSSNQEIPKL